MGPLGGGRTGNAPAPGAGQEQAQQGLVPKAGPAEGHWILQVNQEDGKAFGSASNQTKPGAPASWGLPVPSTSLLLKPPSTSCKGTFVFQFSFPRTTTCSMASLGGAAASPCHPLLCFQQAQPQPDRKPKAFFPQWDAPEGSGRAARPQLLCVGQEQCPAPHALNA